MMPGEEKLEEGAASSANSDASEVFDFRSSQNEQVQRTYELAKPVFFVGFMGAGKTSTARKLARIAGVASVDMDTYIERRTGKKVEQIFAESGEGGFRAVETDVLRELACGEPRLISCGGGAMLAEENRRIVKEHGFVINMLVTADEAASRISNYSHRPLFGDLDNARRIIQDRLPLYAEVADATIDTAGRGTTSIAREAFDVLRREGILVRK